MKLPPAAAGISADSAAPATVPAPRSYFTPFSETPAAPETAADSAAKAVRERGALQARPENETAASGSARGGFVRFSVGE